MKPGLKKNLIIGFGASLIVLIISSAASYISIRNLLYSSYLVDHTYQAISSLENVNFYTKEAESAQRGYLLTSDSSFIQTYKKVKDSAYSSLVTVRLLTADNLEQQQSCSQLKSIIQRRMDSLEDGIERMNHKVVFRSGAIGILQVGELQAMIRTMEDRERRLLIQRTQKLNAFAEFTPMLIILAAVIALLITLFFYFRVIRDYDQRLELQRKLLLKDEEINKRISIIQDIATQIADGNYAIRAFDAGEDGLGNLAYAINRMAVNLEYSFGLLSDKEWLQRGIAGLNDIMLGEKILGQLCRQIIEYITEYTGGSVGAFYLRESDDQLVFYAGYAFAGRKGPLKLGEGILGQAATSGKPILLEDITEENILVSYAAGQIRPSQLIAIPLLDSNQVIGVMEVGSIRKFSARETEFLKSISLNIGTALVVTQNRGRLQELLKKTQSQTEELQLQHAELENLNTELEAHAQKLQVSDEELRVQQQELMQVNRDLHAKTQAVEEKNSLIMQRNIQIQVKAEELAVSTKYKSEFLANMSHELRTPLNSILLLSKLLTDNASHNLTEDQIEYAKVIQSSGKGLLSLIDEILDLSQIESGKMELEYADVPLHEIAEDMRRLFNPIAEERKLQLEFKIGPELPEVIQTDKLKVEQILRNLLSNALKFTSEGYVVLQIDKQKDKPGFLCFNVSDSGIGIPVEKQALIFEAFQQADGSTKRKYGGTGLGLSISRQLAKLLGGEIILKSEPHKGSHFSLSLPIDRSQLQEGEIYPAFGAPPIDVHNTNDPYLTAKLPESIPDDRNDVRDLDKCILIIEDDINFAKTLMGIAREKGYKAIVAVRGDTAAPLALKYQPKGILLDIQLPMKTGWEVLNILKSDDRTRNIPVHIMSSFELEKESILKGAVDFIRKPVLYENLYKVFENIEMVLKNDPKRVLIVDEHSKHARALAYFLESFNVTTKVSATIAESIDSLLKYQADCVIVDAGILGNQSYEMLDVVKKTPGLEFLPIIVFTGRNLSKSEEVRIRKYADSIIIKSVHSFQHILDEVSLFLRLIDEKLPDGSPKIPTAKMGKLDEVLKGKTVLIVDDDGRNIFSLTNALEKYEMHVITAGDGKEALGKLHENGKIDAVLLDMMMPIMDGYETAKRIRQDPRWGELPIIAVTAKAMPSDMEKCISAGASDYVTKPVDVDQLLSLLRIWLYESTK
jgi:signal transduction histidine kinase/CheY-like chemotaxis protein/CHASE3 domain sensor protein